MIKITFENGKEFQSEDKQVSLFRACRAIQAPIVFGCRIGMCGTCKVKVSDPTKVSKKNKAEREFTEDQDERLACQCTISGDVDVIQPKRPS